MSPGPFPALASAFEVSCYSEQSECTLILTEELNMNPGKNLSISTLTLLSTLLLAIWLPSSAWAMDCPDDMQAGSHAASESNGPDLIGFGEIDPALDIAANENRARGPLGGHSPHKAGDSDQHESMRMAGMHGEMDCMHGMAKGNEAGLTQKQHSHKADGTEPTG